MWKKRRVGGWIRQQPTAAKNAMTMGRKMSVCIFHHGTCNVARVRPLAAWRNRPPQNELGHFLKLRLVCVFFLFFSKWMPSLFRRWDFSSERETELRKQMTRKKRVSCGLWYEAINKESNDRTWNWWAKKLSLSCIARGMMMIIWPTGEQ